jgi:hypothetical protein
VDQIIEDLDVREKEINEYLELIEFLDNSRTIHNNQDEFTITPLLIKTVKGSIYLLLYSLVESTMREAVIAIHDEITSSNTRFDSLRDELQTKILNRAKRDGISVTTLISGISGNISLNLHKITLDKKNIFSGNIDREEIKKTADIYGFSSSVDFATTGHGEQLLKVKNNRNNLAHGNKTFSGVGGENSIEELKKFSGKVICYMYEIIDNILDSLEDKLYLKSGT